MNSLNIPVKFRRTGLYVFCNQCKGYSPINDGRLKKVSNCHHPAEKQVYKSKIHVPGTRNDSRTIVLGTRDIEQAVLQHDEFVKRLKNNGFAQENHHIEPNNQNLKYLLIYQMERFIEYKSTGGEFKHENVKIVKKSTINDYKRNFKYFLESIGNSVDLKTFKVTDVNKNHLEKFHLFIKGRSKSKKTYNNIMGQLRAFYNHLIDYVKLKIDNPFSSIVLKMPIYNPLSYTKEEFDRLLAVTTKENGHDTEAKRHRYKEWLPTAFKLGAFSCLRLDELVNLRYSDIQEINGMLVLISDNFKVNRFQAKDDNDDDETKRVKRIRVIPEMLKVLNEECDFAQKKGRQEYILAPSIARSTVSSDITHGFTHYKKVAKIEGQKSFKELRTTFISRVQSTYGDINFTTTVSDHSNESTVRKHYLAQLEAAHQMGEFYVFSEPDDSQE